jgi:hypothetical protein
VVLRNSAASGIRTINESHVIVTPSVIPKPGITLRRVGMIAEILTALFRQFV